MRHFKVKKQKFLQTQHESLLMQMNLPWNTSRARAAW